MTDALIVKYRPRKLSEIVGQKPIINSLGKVIETKSSQSFLFCGPSGTGKTTLARIAAKMMGATSKDILEIDAATNTGVDEMRKLQELLRYKPFGQSKHRALIIDEVHMLSKSAWNSLLKSLEEPPPHISWYLCTTEAEKISATIRRRCASYTLQPVSTDELTDLVTDVAKEEGIKLNDSIRGLIVREANGSPGQALANLSVCQDVTDRETAANLLKTALSSDLTLEFCRFLSKGGGSWMKAKSLIENMGNVNPEGLRILVANYMGSALKNAKGDREVCHLLSVLENFSVPFNSSENIAPLFLAVGRCLYGNQ